ncbi:MAG: PIN domain-containing protein [Fimbriimonadales bacterium]|nr:PIN domain-containing protein [Fimbriimonadales bacterium]
MSVYVDTSAFLATLNPNDRFHSDAARIWRDLVEREALLVCSNYVVVETIALLQSRVGIAAVSAFVDDVQPSLQIEWVSESDHALGVHLLRSLNRRRVSLVDCVSFVQMQRMGIQQAFAFDPHYSEQGFILIS